MYGCIDTKGEIGQGYIVSRPHKFCVYGAFEDGFSYISWMGISNVGDECGDVGGGFD